MNDPFSYFNVYSLKDIDYWESDFQGTTGAAGNVTVNNFTFYGMDPNTYVLHTGGAASISSGTHNGFFEALNDITLANVTINGNVNSGGDITNTAGGTINGDVNAAGIADISQSMGFTNANSGTPYTPVVDINATSSYFTNYSMAVGARNETGTIINHYGHLKINAVTGINVLCIDGSDLKNAYAVTVDGPEDAVVFINVLGDDVVLDSTNWYYTSGISADDLLLNYWTASSLSLSGGNKVNILAPFADTTFSSGVLTGNLIVGNLGGHGQVNLGHFTAPSEPVPEPASMLLFFSGLFGLASCRRKLFATNFR